MTGVGGRPELIVEGSNFTDGGWMEYEFLYKPGDVYRRPPVVGKWGCGDKILYKDGNTVEGYHRVELWYQIANSAVPLAVSKDIWAEKLCLNKIF